MLKKLGLTTMALAGLLTLIAPTTMLAREHEGGRNYSNGRGSYGGGRNFNGGEHRFSEGRGGYGGDRDRGYYRGGDHDRDRGYYRGGSGFSFGYSSPRYYAPSYSYRPACGFYDQWGYWNPTPCNAGQYYGY